MSADTSIEWATHSFSPWHGCQKVSAGCKNCYAEVSTPVRVKRARGLELWGPAKTTRRVRTAESTWKLVRSWNRRAQEEHEAADVAARSHGPMAAPWERPRVFPSLCDVFEDHPDAAAIRPDFWALIEETPELDWLLLTKRPENVRRMVPESWTGFAARPQSTSASGDRFRVAPRWPSNVWIGTSVEDQATADERIPHILAVPAPVRFLSLEPLLGPLSLRAVALHGTGWSCDPLRVDDRGIDDERLRHIDWLIIGGESGPNARPCDVAWIRDLVRQGRAAGVPVFVKQVGSRIAGRIGADIRSGLTPPFVVPGNDPLAWMTRAQHPKGGDPAEWPEDLRVREMPRR